MDKQNTLMTMPEPPSDREYQIYKALPYSGEHMERVVVAKVLLRVVESAETGRPVRYSELRQLIDALCAEAEFQNCVEPVAVECSVMKYRQIWVEDALFGDDDFEEVAENLNINPETLLEALQHLRKKE